MNLCTQIFEARAAWKKTLLALVEDKDIRFLAGASMNLGKLKPASVFQSTDSLREGRKGIFIGAGLGLIAGLMALAFPPWYTDTGWPLILTITTGIGAVVGMLCMAMLGVNLKNSDLDVYSDQIADGGVLMMVTVPEARANQICRILQKPKRRILGIRI